VNKENIQDRFKFWFKTRLDNYPEAYIKFLHYKYKNRPFHRFVVNRDTDLVIEGFPRSANSFAVRAFNALQKPKEYKVATHVHSPSQIIYGAKLGVPTLALIRNPDACLISLKALNYEYSQKYPDRYPFISGFNHLAAYYVNFYNRLLPYCQDIVISDFKDTINDFETVIKRINKHYSTSFVHSGLTEEKKDHIFQNFGFHLSPSANRDEIKDRFKKDYEKNCSPKLRSEMNRVYDNIREQMVK